MAKKIISKRSIDKDIPLEDLPIIEAVANVCLGARSDIDPNTVLDLVLACYFDEDSNWTDLGRLILAISADDSEVLQ